MITTVPVSLDVRITNAHFFVHVFVYLFMVCFLSTSLPSKNQGHCLVHGAIPRATNNVIHIAGAQQILL